MHHRKENLTYKEIIENYANPGSSLPAKYYSGDQIKKNEMGRACGTYGRQERCIQGFGGKT
jgi:hypothetical protein